MTPTNAERIIAILAKHADADAGNAGAWDDAGPDTLAKSALVLLATKPDLPERDSLAASLAAEQRYYGYLIDVDLLSLDQSVSAAAALCRADQGFLAGLFRTAGAAAKPATVMRALELIDRLQKAVVAAQWIRRTTEHPDPIVRSKAVKILSCLHVNVAFIEKQLGSKDARVRANAVEALWGVNTPTSRQLLERAANDPHQRVMANGLLGLSHLGIPGITRRIVQAAKTNSPELRRALAWLMGQTEGEQFEEELKRLAADPEETVKEQATRSLNGRKRGAAAGS
jgi:HEAT repeat protein